MSSGKYPFPSLRAAPILQVMAELNIPLTEAELTQPGRCRERVREVFVQLLCLCWGLTESQLTTLSSRVQSSLTAADTTISSHPQLYKDAFAETKFLCLLQTLFKSCSYNDFGFRDLAAPTGRRFRMQLSALINYMKYRQDMNHLLTTTLEERADMFDALEEVAGEHLKLNDQLDELKEIHEQKLLEREEAEAECQEMEAEIAQQNKIQSSIRQQNQLLITSATELKDQIAHLNIALRELQAEERQLNKEVVHSPDRVKADVHKAEKELEEIKRLIVQKEDERNVLSKKLKNAVKGEEHVKHTVELMEDMDEVVQQYEIAAEDADDLSGNVDKIEIGLNKKRSVREEKEIEIKAIEQQHLNIKAKLTKQLEAAKNELNSAVETLGLAEKERVDGIARMEASQRRVEELEALIEADRRRTNDCIKKRIEDFRKYDKMMMSRYNMLNDLVAQ